MSLTDKSVRPLREGLYRDGALVAGVSRKSSRIHFPKPDASFESDDGQIEEIVLGSTCTLFSFTTVHMKTAHFDPPYCIGYVDFPEGVRVFGPIRAENVAALRVGLPMTVEIAPLWQEADGATIIAHRFVPIEECRS